MVVDIDPIVLHEKGIYYLNGMETLASATELETIAAKNIANMIVKKYSKK